MVVTLPPARAFLSHSSHDKTFVQQVFEGLGPTLAELDEVTLEPAKFNRDVILRALDRCSAFVLFASEHSVKSTWVAEEIKEALARFRGDQIARIIVYCADKVTFRVLEPELKDLNIVRIEKTPLVCARQIRGILAEVFAERTRSDVFITRDENLAELKRLVIDPSKDFRALAISGFDRLGRRALVRKFCQDVYGSFNVPTQSVFVELSSSFDDIFRQLLGLQYKNIEQAALIDRLKQFSESSEGQQIALIGSEIRAIYAQREFVQFVDAGGLLGDDGDLSKPFQSILAQNADITDLIHILILFRNAPDWVKKKYPDIAFYRLTPLTDSQAEVAISHELKKRKVVLPKHQIVRLISIADGHPANLDYIVGYIFAGNELNPVRLNEVITESAEFANWKRGRATAYVNRFRFSDTDRLLIGLLVRYRGLPAEPLARYMFEKGIDTAALGNALGRLLELNIVDVNGSEYRLIRPLRDALERDNRFSITAQQSDEFAKSLVENLQDYGAGDSVPIALIDSATIASIRGNAITPGWVHQLVLPSHYIWLARESYHKRDYQDSLGYSRKALELTSTMTQEARLEALRFAGLSCARIGLDDEFAEILKQIDKIGIKRARGNKHFLSGFYSRLKGSLEIAHSELVKAAEILSGSIDIQRELISVLIARQDFEGALAIAKDLVQRADNNPYVLDGYVQARIAVAANVDALLYDAEFTKRLEQLEEVGDGPGQSFYCLRKVDLALKKRNKSEALDYSARALVNTPNLPAAHAARARALIADGDYDKAWLELQEIEAIGAKRNRIRDGLEKLVLYQVRFELNLQRGRYPLCRADIENMMGLDTAQARAMKMDLVQKVATTGASVDAGLVAWLKK